MRKEIVQEMFFPAPTRDGRGQVVPAPSEAMLFLSAFQNGWFKDYPESRDVIPSVGIHPVREESREGYVVQKILVYRE